MIYFCCTQQRRESVKTHLTINGIDFLEVLDDSALPNDQRQRTLFVHFLNTHSLSKLKEENLRIEGGERIDAVKVIGVNANANVLTVTIDKPGDFSIYTLRLVKKDDPSQPPGDFDPLLASVDFSFKVECPDDFDCAPTRVCPPEARIEPELDYLAKDYNSFRQLMLDRISTLMPQWKERNAADLGIAVVELLAYVGDHLSYRQDVIANEAYLGTARRRVSVRRHARLVDYRMHDGSNARAWVQLQVSADGVFVPRKTQLFTRLENQDPRIATDLQVYNRALAQNPTVFETMDDALLFGANNEINFYTWGESECCLPKGATHATLRDVASNRLLLCVGDVLIFEERRGPKTNDPADADPMHRHAVRLKRVNPEAQRIFKITQASLNELETNNVPADSINKLHALTDQEFSNEQDFLTQLNTTLGEDATVQFLSPIERFSSARRAQPILNDPLTQELIVEIEWADEDALLFPLCVSATSDKEPVSIALGNIVLADHGMTIDNESLGCVPESILSFVPVANGDRCDDQPLPSIPPRYRPALSQRPVTQIGRVRKTTMVAGRHETTLMQFDPDAPASAVFKWQMAHTLSAIRLSSTHGDVTMDWTPQRDLLNSAGDKTEFVVEVENDGTAYLRFGDNDHGMRPEPNTSFTATYRVGNGAQGNIGADALGHIVSDDPHITRVRNPLPAHGGTDPESIEDVRQRAPFAFRTQERAVTANDYAMMAQRSDPRVQRAAGTFRWTGSWRTMFVTVDRFGGVAVDAGFKQDIAAELEPYRMAGQDLDVDGPIYVSLDIEIQVCVKPDYFRSAVKKELLEIFSNRVLPDGRLGIFHPDKFTFGQTVFLSPLYAAAQAVQGVESVVITKFRRQGTDNNDALDAGKLELGRLQIARCDNDPNFPEHGVFRLTMNGGK